MTEQKKVDLVNQELVIMFTGVSPDEFGRLLTVCRNLDNRTFEKEGRYWRAAFTPNNMSALQEAGFEFTAKLQSFLKKPVSVETPVSKPFQQEPIDPTLKKEFPTLYPYQLAGIEFAEKHNGVCLIGDEMGLGKTCQALCYVKRHPVLRKVLIVCPAVVKLNWYREIEKWVGISKIEILHGETPYQLGTPRFTIINYDILTPWIGFLATQDFQLIIGDEIQYISNQTQRTEAFQKLAQEIPQKIFLSGTPIKNKPAEFFNALNLLNPTAFPNRYAYLHRYCNPTLKEIWRKVGGRAKMIRKVWEYNGATNLQELRSMVVPLMIRREKEEVLPDLPRTRKIIIPLEVNEEALQKYTKADTIFKEWAQNINVSKQEGETHVELLKQLAYLAKRDSVIQWIADFLETGMKLVVFAFHTNVIDDLMKKFGKKAVVLDGSVKEKGRQEAVDKFWKDPSTQLFIGQVTAAGAGINLQCASAVAFLEFPWTPADCEQAEGRISRIGQKADSIAAYYLVAENTIDLHIAEMLTKKNKVTKELLDGKEDASFFGENDLLDALIKRYRSQ